MCDVGFLFGGQGTLTDSKLLKGLVCMKSMAVAKVLAGFH